MPTLPPDPYDALTLENDIVGVRVWGPASQPTLLVNRADVWDRRWFVEREPLITLAQLRERAMSDRLAELNSSYSYSVYQRYDFPCPKPGAQVILGTPFAHDAQARQLPDGSVELVAEGEGKSLHARIWVSLLRPLVVVSCQTAGLSADDCWVRVYRHCDTILPGEPVDPTLGGEPSDRDFAPLPAPRAFQQGEIFGIAQDFPPEETFPAGFTAAVAAAVTGDEVSVTPRDGECGLGTPLWAAQEGRVAFCIIKRYAPINAAPGAAVTATFAAAPSAFTLIVALATTHDGPDAVAAASRMLDEARALGVEGLLAEHQEARRQHTREHRAAIRRRGAGEGEACLFAAPAVVFPRLRRSDGYYGDVPLCSVGSTKLWFQDAGLWHNDFHLNELRAERMLMLGQFPELLPYCEMISTLLPQAEENARAVYDLPGAMYPLAHFPLRRSNAHANQLPFGLDLGLNGLVSKPLWLYYRYTGDVAYLRALAYPVLRACARFCRAYLTEEADGYLHIVPTVSPEHWGLTAQFMRNRDCLSALTLTRYLLHAAAAAARVLKVDTNEAAEWTAAAARLAPYPTFQTPEGPVWVDVAGAPPIEYNIPVPLAGVFWGDEVGLDSPPAVLAIARRTLAHIHIWPPHRTYLNGSIRHRLGVWNDDSSLAPESFLLSYQSLRLFPNVPPHSEVTIENLAAEGGFRVSAARTAAGVIEDVTITSTLGHRCLLANPWPGMAAEVIDSSGQRIAGSRQRGFTHQFRHRSWGRVSGVDDQSVSYASAARQRTCPP